jgi:hypothetical protein
MTTSKTRAHWLSCLRGRFEKQLGAPVTPQSEVGAAHVAIGFPLLDPAKRIGFVQENVFVEQTLVGDTVFVFQALERPWY